MQRHPLARVRTKAQLPYGRSFPWEVPEVTDTDPLDRVTCASDPDMGRARGRHQAQAGSYAGMESQTWGAQCLLTKMLFAVAVAVKTPLG